MVIIDTSVPLAGDVSFQLPASKAHLVPPANTTSPSQGGSEGQGGGESSGAGGGGGRGEPSAVVARNLLSIKVSMAMMVMMLILGI